MTAKGECVLIWGGGGVHTSGKGGFTKGGLTGGFTKRGVHKKGGSSSSSFSVQGSVFRRIDALLGEFRVGGGVHDSYTFQCGLVGSFISPGIDIR